MTDVKNHIVIDQGASFSQSFTILDDLGEPIDITGRTANSNLKRWYTSNAIVHMSSTVNADAHTVTVSLTTSQTANLIPGRYVYNVKLHDPVSNTTTRVIDGLATVTPDV
jgi:hypothetical protein